MDDHAPTAPNVRVVLVGMMGSGKSSVGAALAARTGWPFIDNDQLLERATGRTARDLLEREGERALRTAESDALRAAVRVPPPAIVATAAGTVMDAADRSVLDGGGFVVWLHASADVLAARAAGAAHRPWLADDPVAWFRRTLDERERLYAGIADLAVDTTMMDAEETAQRILTALRGA